MITLQLVDTLGSTPLISTTIKVTCPLSIANVSGLQSLDEHSDATTTALLAAPAAQLCELKNRIARSTMRVVEINTYVGDRSIVPIQTVQARVSDHERSLGARNLFDPRDPGDIPAQAKAGVHDRPDNDLPHGS
jgi:hypothetical protein